MDNTTTMLAVGAAATAALAAGYFLGAAQEKKKHWSTEPKICDTILDHVGNTPLVRLNKIPQAEGVEMQLNVKNATDEEYIMRTNGVHHADPAPARQAILALNLRF